VNEFGDLDARKNTLNDSFAIRRVLPLSTRDETFKCYSGNREYLMRYAMLSNWFVPPEPVTVP
jgi:hypothetical protein